MADSKNLVLRLLITAKDEASAAMGGLKTKLGELGAQAASLARGGLAALAAALIAIFKHGLDAAADFETVMARIQAAGVSGKAELERLADAAKQLGAASGLGPTQVAEGLENLVKAGLSAKDALATLPQVIALAQGQMMSMAEASDLVVKTVNGFGLEFADSKRVVDLFATGANSAATSVRDLRQALENVTGAARANGLSLEQTIAALNTLIQNGIPAAEAGEALQNMLLELSDASGKTYQQLLAAGTATTGFNGALELLNRGGPQARDFLATFGETALTAAQILANSQPFYQDQVKQLSAIGVSAEGAAKIMGGTFQQSLSALKATLSEFGQALVEPYLPKFTAAFQDATKWINENRQALNDWITAGLSPVTLAVDGLRIAMAKLEGDELKVAEIQQEIEARTLAIGRALSGTSGEYQRATTATKQLGAASGALTEEQQRQIEKTQALATAARDYADKAKTAAAGSELQKYYLAQARLETEVYREELAKLSPELRQFVTNQQASNTALIQIPPAAQGAAQGVAEISRATGEAIPIQQAWTDGANAMVKGTSAQTDEWYRQLPAQERLALAMAAYTEAAGQGKDKTTQLTEEIARVRQASAGWRDGMNLNVITLNSLRDTSELTAQKLAVLEERQRAGEKVEQEVVDTRQAADAALARYNQGLQQYVTQQERAVAAAERETQLGQQEADLYVQRAQLALDLARAKGDANAISRAEAELLDAQVGKITEAVAGQQQQIVAYDALIEATQRKLAADGELNASDQAQLAAMADKRAAMALEKQALIDTGNAALEKAAAEKKAAEEAKAAAEEAAAAQQQAAEDADREARRMASTTAYVAQNFDQLSEKGQAALRAIGTDYTYASMSAERMAAAITEETRRLDGAAGAELAAADRLKKLQAAAAGVGPGADRAREALANMSRSGGAGIQGLTQAGEQAIETLRGIKAAAEQAAQSLAEMAGDFERQMLQMQGKQGELLELEHQDNLRRLQELHQQAGDDGDDEYAKAVNRANQLHALKLRQLQEEDAEKKRTAASDADTALGELERVRKAAEETRGALQGMAGVDLSQLAGQAATLKGHFQGLHELL